MWNNYNVTGIVLDILHMISILIFKITHKVSGNIPIFSYGKLYIKLTILSVKFSGIHIVAQPSLPFISRTFFTFPK